MSNEKQAALAAIEGLELSDCIQFFDAKATERDKKIVALVETGDEDFEVDNNIVSEGEDNGAYVMGWRWASFSGTEFDKEADDKCRKCGEPNDDGEGWNGLCGNCADIEAEKDGENSQP